uniref:Uncharacterized protein n=1 Tax=Anopheles albimanus TaxID=7167 RepID=A0A182F899_ANOAL
MKRLFAGDSMLGPLAMPMHRCILDAPRGDANGTQSPVMELHPSSPSVLRRGSVAFSPVGRSPDFVASRRDADATSQMQDDGGERNLILQHATRHRAYSSANPYFIQWIQRYPVPPSASRLLLLDKLDTRPKPESSC